MPKDKGDRTSEKNLEKLSEKAERFRNDSIKDSVKKKLIKNLKARD